MNNLNTIIALIPKLIEAIGIGATIVEIASQTDGTKGTDKKVKAIAQVRTLLTGVKLPALLEQNFDSVVGLLIDVVVAVFNKTGLFTKSA